MTPFSFKTVTLNFIQTLILIIKTVKMFLYSFCQNQKKKNYTCKSFKTFSEHKIHVTDMLDIAPKLRSIQNNTYIRHNCNKRMCYKKWQSFRSSIFKAILHERKAIFPTKQTYITKQMQWYFYILGK